MEQVLSFAPAVLDIAVVLAVFCCVVLRGSRGLTRSLLPLAATASSVILALILGAALRERVTEALYPWLEEQLLRRMDLSSIRSRAFEDISSQLSRLLPDMVGNMAERLELDLDSFITEAMGVSPGAAGRQIAEQAVSALLLPITEALVRSLLPLLLFLALRLVMGLLLSVVGFVPPIPILHGLDCFLGALLGLLECAAVLWLLCRIAEAAGFAPALDILRETRLISLFLRHS